MQDSVCTAALPVIMKNPICGPFVVNIDGNEYTGNDLLLISHNDGFDHVQDFKDFFLPNKGDEVWEGQLVCWTSGRYSKKGGLMSFEG